MAYIAVNADVSGVWRKVQGEMIDGINLKSEEFGTLRDDIQGLKIAPSLREMTYPVRLTMSGGVASIPEGGREANPLSVNATDATIAFCHKNKRFSISKLAHWASMDSMGRQAEIKNQMMFQGLDAVDSVAADLADSFWGLSSSVVCTTTTAATQASGTYTLTNGYGLSTITDGVFISNKIEVGETVALVRSNALVANAIGVVTAKATTPSATITWAGTVTSVSGDQLVKANSYNATTLAHTSYNKNFVGILDMALSASVHGISGSANSGWTVAHSDATGGRFNGIKWRKGLDQIANYGAGGTGNVVTWMAQGVYRDVMQQYEAGLRFDSPFALEIDGDLKGRGKPFQRTRRVPPKFVVSYVMDAVKKRELLPAPDQAPSFSDAKEQIDDSGYTFALDYPALMACMGRKKFAYWSSQTEQ